MPDFIPREKDSDNQIILYIHGCEGDNDIYWKDNNRQWFDTVVEGNDCKFSQYSLNKQYKTMDEAIKSQVLKTSIESSFPVDKYTFSEVVFVCHAEGGLICADFLVNGLHNVSVMQDVKIGLLFLSCPFGRYKYSKRNKKLANYSHENLVTSFSTFLLKRVEENNRVSGISLSASDDEVEDPSARYFFFSEENSIASNLKHHEICKALNSDACGIKALLSLIKHMQTREEIKFSHFSGDQFSFIKNLREDNLNHFFGSIFNLAGVVSEFSEAPEFNERLLGICELELRKSGCLNSDIDLAIEILDRCDNQPPTEFVEGLCSGLENEEFKTSIARESLLKKYELIKTNSGEYQDVRQSGGAAKEGCLNMCRWTKDQVEDIMESIK